jgi:tetrahydromethanopterin S-methyltransferase subunit E
VGDAVEPVMLAVGVLALIVGLVTVAGWFEDAESDVGSQSNPNSQVQLAPQVGTIHRFFNKAISGEPISNGMWCMTAGTIFVALWLGWNVHPLISIPISCGLTTLFHMTLATTAYLGRIASQRRFGQPIYIDVLLSHLPLIGAHGFMVTLTILAVSYIMYIASTSTILNLDISRYIGYPIVIPILALMLGIISGSIGSSTGDVHYGGERLYQHTVYGEGISTKHYGAITVKAELGWRNSIDTVWFCSKYGSMMAGLCYGLILLFDNFRLFLGSIYGQTILNVGVGVAILLMLILANRWIEVWSRRRFGPYMENTGFKGGK